MRQLKWLALNGLFATFTYLGFIEGIDGARNVAYFNAWLVIICTLLLLSSYGIDHLTETIKVKGRSAPCLFNVIVESGIALTFIWFGAWITGLFLILSLMIQEATIKGVLDHLNKETTSEH